MVAAPFDEKDADYTLGDFTLTQDCNLLIKQGGKITFYHSKDDPVVPYIDVEKYKKALPDATIVTFDNKGHFNESNFPELVNDIQALRKD